MIDFFNENCQTNTQVIEFGIVDPENSPAQISAENTDEWIAVVQNDNAQNILFTAIDKCIPMYRTSGDMENRCDCMLTYNRDIDFIELKEARSEWIKGGIQQLKTTILIFNQHIPSNNFRRRRAYLANRLHPRFKYSHKEDMQKFRDETQYRLIIENKVKI